MTTLDVILLLCFVPAVWEGVSKGLIKQLVGIAGLFIGVWLARKFCLPAGEWLAPHLDKVNPQVINIICFTAIFFIALLLCGLLGRLLTGLVKFASLGWFNRLLGVVFGIFKTALLLALLVCLFEELNDKFNIAGRDFLDESAVYGYLKDFGDRFFPYIKALITKGNA